MTQRDGDTCSKSGIITNIGVETAVGWFEKYNDLNLEQFLMHFSNFEDGVAVVLLFKQRSQC